MSTTTISTHSQVAAQTRPHLSVAWLGFLVVLASAVMDLLDSTIAQTAAPAIQRDLGGSYASLEWISAAYTLAMAATLLLGSRLGDAFGRRRVLLVGMAGFVGASMLCALAPSSTALIVGRAVQGALAAIMVPQGFGLIRELFGDEGQQKAFAVFGPVMGLAAVAGPLLGGGLVDLDVLGTGWRAIFLVNVPIGLAAIAAGRRYLPRVAPAHPRPAAGRDQRADGDGRQRRAHLPARRGTLPGLAGVVVGVLAAGASRWERSACCSGGARARAARRWWSPRSCAAGPTSPAWPWSSASSGRWAG